VLEKATSAEASSNFFIYFFLDMRLMPLFCC
jgi:hypothetical protein